MERVLDLVLQRLRERLARHVVAGEEDVGQLPPTLGLDGLDLLQLGLGQMPRPDQVRLQRIARVPASVARRDDLARLEEDDRDIIAGGQLEHARFLLNRDQLKDFGEAEIVEVSLERHVRVSGPFGRAPVSRPRPLPRPPGRSGPRRVSSSWRNTARR